MHRGVYAGLLGPSYETRAEYRMCRRIGADAVGMSTIPEIVQASASKIPVLAVSIITNVATTTIGQPTTGHQVIASAAQAAQGLGEIFAGLLAD
jgi:purine-nucleoside phosphorylase